MTVIEGDGGCLVIDAGLAFPRDEHLGVDLVLPDISYLADRGRPVDAVVLTHAHEDHVGGLPYLLREVDVPRIIGTTLTLGLVQSKLAEHKLTDRTELVEVRPEDGPVEEGPFRLELVRMAHSIPDNAGVVVEVGGQRILHTSDYKLDHTPDRRLQDRRRASRRARQPRRRSHARRLDERRAARLHRARRGSSARRSARSSRCARGGYSSHRSPRTSTACSRRSTSPSNPAARCASSDGRCGRTSTSRARSATWRCPTTRS